MQSHPSELSTPASSGSFLQGSLSAQDTSSKHCVSQVLSKALEVWDLQCIPQEAPDMVAARQHPEREQAFICNLEVGCPAGQ